METVRDCGTDVKNLVFDEQVSATLAFVHTMQDGDRDFSFYRNPGADMMLKKEKVMEEVIKSGRVFSFCTLSSTHGGVREATRYAIRVVKDNGLLISFEPYLGKPLWTSLVDAKRKIAYGLSQCGILKISDNELEFMTGTADYTRAVSILRENYQIPLIFVTMDRDGRNLL